MSKQIIIIVIVTWTMKFKAGGRVRWWRFHAVNKNVCENIRFSTIELDGKIDGKVQWNPLMTVVIQYEALNIKLCITIGNIYKLAAALDCLIYLIVARLFQSHLWGWISRGFGGDARPGFVDAISQQTERGHNN